MVQTPAAELRDDTRSNIIEAAARILRDQGARAVTTRAVAQAAGVQAPTIYRLFGDKDGLVDAVAEHVMATYVAAKAEMEEDGGDPLVHLRTGWRTQIEFGLANPWLYALMTAPAREQRSPAQAAGMTVLRARVRRLAEAGLLRVDESHAVAMIQAAGVGTVLTLLATPADQRDLGLPDTMFDAVTAGILAAAPALPRTDVSTVAVTFGTIVPDLPALTPAERTLLSEWLTRSLTHLSHPAAAE